MDDLCLSCTTPDRCLTRGDCQGSSKRPGRDMARAAARAAAAKSIPARKVQPPVRPVAMPMESVDPAKLTAAIVHDPAPSPDIRIAALDARLQFLERSLAPALARIIDRQERIFARLAALELINERQAAAFDIEAVS